VQVAVDLSLEDEVRPAEVGELHEEHQEVVVGLVVAEVAAVVSEEDVVVADLVLQEVEVPAEEGLEDEARLRFIRFKPVLRSIWNGVIWKYPDGRMAGKCHNNTRGASTIDVVLFSSFI
jgi:hypothetical protein